MSCFWFYCTLNLSLVNILGFQFQHYNDFHEVGSQLVKRNLSVDINVIFNGVTMEKKSFIHINIQETEASSKM
jgi:hypothetical protein